MSDTNLEPRVAKLEGQLEQLVSAVETHVISADKWQRQLSADIDALGNTLNEKIGNVERPDWVKMGVWATIILGIVGMVGGAVMAGYASNQNRIEAAVAVIQGNEFERGKSAQKIEDATQATMKLDEVLQREMREVNATTTAKTEALEKRQQSDAQVLAEALTNKIESVKELLQVRHDETEIRYVENHEAILALQAWRDEQMRMTKEHK